MLKSMWQCAVVSEYYDKDEKLIKSMNHKAQHIRTQKVEKLVASGQWEILDGQAANSKVTYLRLKQK